MTYNPQIHHRRSIRLKGYDYAQAGAYFITICCEKMEWRFGNIVGASLPAAQNVEDINEQPQGIARIDAQMELNEYGMVAYNEWNKLPERFSNFELDVFQIMPNHMHGIIVLHGVGATLAVAHERAEASPAPTIGDIVGAYKSLVANGCLDIFRTKNKTMGKLWQRNYHEHIIRNEKSYQTISNYIINNPAKWKDDKFYSE